MSADTTLFAYGSLMFPEVWCYVVGRDRPSSAATLRGYSAFSVRGQCFPGLVQSSPRASTHGRLYFGLAADDWSKLDEFEDSFYSRREVVVEAAGGGRTYAACTYLVAGAHKGVLSDQIWSSEYFAENDLNEFLDRISGFEPLG